MTVTTMAGKSASLKVAAATLPTTLTVKSDGRTLGALVCDYAGGAAVLHVGRRESLPPSCRDDGGDGELLLPHVQLESHWKAEKEDADAWYCWPEELTGCPERRPRRVCCDTLDRRPKACSTFSRCVGNVPARGGYHASCTTVCE